MNIFTEKQYERDHQKLMFNLAFVPHQTFQDFVNTSVIGIMNNYG